jgi:hypothetical protein
VRIESGGAKGARLVAERAFRAKEVIGRFEGYSVSRRPTYLSIQIGPDRHIENIGAFSYLNHSCAPTTEIDTEAMLVRAARDIQAGDELNFFYPATEWEMDRPFTCVCGAPECLGAISGARSLSQETLERYTLSRHIRDLLAASRQFPPSAGEG